MCVCVCVCARACMYAGDLPIGHLGVDTVVPVGQYVSRHFGVRRVEDS